MRHRLEVAEKRGMLAGSAMIAHGRGEAFDYLLANERPRVQALHHGKPWPSSRLGEASGPQRERKRCGAGV